MSASTSSNEPVLPSLSPTILVAGDVVRDIYLYEGDRILPAQRGKIEPRLIPRLGGAGDLFELLSSVRLDAVKWGHQEPKSLEALQTVHTLWTACDGGTKREQDEAGKANKPVKVWRVKQSLGYTSDPGLTSALPKSPEAEQAHAVLLLDDAGLNFRTQPAFASWPHGVQQSQSPQPDWIIHKMANPIAQGDLWRALIGGPDPAPRKNLVVVVSADELRRAGAAISRGVSWERTLSDLCAELNHNPRFQPLLHYARRLIVNFGCVASVWFGESNGPTQDGAKVVFDPSLPEGGWKTRMVDEQHEVYGHLNVFTAAIALAALQAGSELPDLDAAMQRGLAACRQLRLAGHGAISNEKPKPPYDELRPILTLNDAAAKAIGKEKKLQRLVPHGGFQIVSGNIKSADFASWTLAALAENPPDQPALPLYGLAHRVALYGHSALEHIPHAYFGSLLSVDRREMETLRSITVLIERYKKLEQPKQPLSIAAFGPPGAGKSFGIKEIARQILGENVSILEFNLSQFDSAAGLLGAFHQVRDKCLKGHIPVVFWDEFDSRDYKWLQHLLAPMQDGTFDENGHTHAIGKCIFVFAGGTSWDFEHFGPAPMPARWQPGCPAPKAGDSKRPSSDKPSEAAELKAFYDSNEGRQLADQQANDDFRRQKGPDFLSRLDGYINVLGPNQRMEYKWSTRTWATPDAHDITFPVRRALLLRQFLNATKPGDQLAIDRDLLRAFLLTPRYRHGARSLEKIARHLALSNSPFRRADLPPPQVLAQHLDTAEAFDQVYRQNQEFLVPENLEHIAAAIDENYMRLADEHAAQTAKEVGKSHQPRAPLREADFTAAFALNATSSDSWKLWLAATNRAAAQRLPWLLDIAGLQLSKGTATASEQEQISAYLKQHLNCLAEAEHALWMEFHVNNGWQRTSPAQEAHLQKLKADIENAPADQKPAAEDVFKAEISRLKKAERRHTLIRPFEELSGKEKEKDHDSIVHLPDMAALVGWKVAFVHPPAQAP